LGNSADKLRHLRSDAYLAEQVLLNKQQIWSGIIIIIIVYVNQVAWPIHTQSWH